MAAEKKTYVVTEAAGLYVAGKRVREGQELALTDSQAAYELSRNVIQLKEMPKAEPVAAQPQPAILPPVEAHEAVDAAEHPAV